MINEFKKVGILLKDFIEYKRIEEKVNQLKEEANRLMGIADSFAEKGDKEQFRAYWLQSAKKSHEAQTLLTADIENLLKEMMQHVEKNCLNR